MNMRFLILKNLFVKKIYGFLFPVTVYENNIKAMASVTIMLNSCAIKNAYSGVLLFCLKRSAKFVSNPMLVKASANQRPCKFFKLSFTPAVVSGQIKNENKIEAPINPNTNFGKRSHITISDGFVLASLAAECFV